MEFNKYQGIGNDFLVVDFRGDPSAVPEPKRVASVCDRRFGVGGDGILAILPPVTGSADARMQVLNADGSIAEMCGNGIRCVAKYLYENDPALSKPVIVIDTDAGPLGCEVIVEGGSVTQVKVDMGPPRLSRSVIPMTGPKDEHCVRADITAASETFPITAVSMGNPHAITFTKDTGTALRARAERIGPSVENHAWFPNRTNAEFARVVSKTEIELVVWERGCGITLACGTGACATVVAACIEGHSTAGTDVRVRLLGGDLTIRVEPDMSRVWMTGPAAFVFSGDI